MRSLPGIVRAEASYQDGKAVVEFDPQQVSPEQIAQAINERTYYRATVLAVGEGDFSSATPEEVRPAATATATIVVEGMTDDLSASQVLAAMGSPAVTDVSVDTSRSQLTVSFDPSRVDPSWFVNIINNTTPFKASLVEVVERGGNGGGVNPIWFVAAGAVAGAGILAWYGIARVRRRPLLARAQRGGETRRRPGRR